MIVYIHCQKLRGDVSEPAKWYRNRKDQIEFAAPQNLSIKEIVSVVTSQVRKFGQMSTLHLNAHGAPGHLYLGKGLHIGNYRDMKPLANLMGLTGKVQIHGCNIAADYTVGDKGVGGTGKGYQLLYSMATMFAVPVTGGIDVQWGQSANSKGKFWGPLVTVQPNGNAQTWEQAKSPARVRSYN